MTRRRALLALLAPALVAAPAAVAHPPALGVLPAGMTVEATSAQGATVAYAVPTATHDGTAVAVTCTPASGTVFRLGRTVVTCSAADPGTKETASASFDVAVVDRSPPAFGAAPEQVAEATGAAGAVVTYPLPVASDAVDGARPVSCSPAPGSRFPLGRTAVRCTAADSRGHASSTTFDVVVRDTTPPVFRRFPADMRKKIDGRGPVVVTYQQPLATDSVDGRVEVTCDPASGSRLPLGSTIVACSATDSAGNVESLGFEVEVVDETAPPQVGALTVTPGNRLVRLTWQLPPASDLEVVEVVRFPGSRGASQSILYRGAGTTFVDRGVSPGGRYRYVVTAIDHVGNRSAAATRVAVAKRLALFAPAYGATVTGRPVLRWLPVRDARYYNVQLYRGAQKILSIWPRSPILRLSLEWAYNGRQFRLTPGTYRWYVWPGFGPLRAARYGKVLGSSTFIVR